MLYQNSLSSRVYVVLAFGGMSPWLIQIEKNCILQPTLLANEPDPFPPK